MWMLPLQVMKRHAACNCPYHAYVDATCASVEKMINDMTDRMIETMKERITEQFCWFNRSTENCTEPNSSLGSPKPEVSLYDDFESSYLARPDLHNDMPLPIVE